MSLFGCKKTLAHMTALGGYFETALHAASHQGDINLVRLLIEYGADTNIQGDIRD
jgi:ankyrin repeat protein